MGIWSRFSRADKLAEDNPDVHIYEGDDIDTEIMTADERGDGVLIAGTWHNRAAHQRYDDDGRAIEQGPNNETNNLPWWRR